MKESNMNTRKRALIWLAATVVAVVSMVTPLSILMAQDEAKPATETTAAKDKAAPVSGEKTLWELIKVGGWIMVPIGLMSVAGAALVIRNFMVLQDKKLLRPDLIPTMQQHMAMRDVYQVQQMCVDNPSLLTSVLSAGLERVTGNEIDLETIEEAIQESSTEQMVSYMVPISYLSIIGVVAPMLGLLGTVSGMIKAFYKLAAGGMGKPELLAENIGEAMVTTAAGLILAIPAMAFYFYFKGNFMKTMASLGRITGTLIESLRSGQLPSTFNQPAQTESSKS
jgi:biopolymer transport protein ExbB